MKIFISYSWKDSTIVDKIDNDFQSIGISLIRDVRDINYKDNLKSFMKMIRDCDYAILIVSSAYLKSKNCLFEVMEIRKEKEYSKKILPLLDSSADIFRYDKRIDYIKYWEKIINEFDESLQTIDRTDSIELTRELKEHKVILGEIDNFIQNLVDIKCQFVGDAQKTFYSDILSHIKYEPKIVYEEIAKIDDIINMDEKEAQLELLTKKYPNSSILSFKKAYNALVGRKNAHQAIVLFETHMEKYGDFDNAVYHNLGMAYGEINNFDKAIDCINKAIEVDKTSHKSYFLLALVYIKQGDFHRAKDYMLESIKLNGEEPKAHFYLGNIHFHHFNNPDEAIIHYLKSLKLDPKQKHAYSNIFLIYLDYKKDIEQAENILTRAIEAMPETPEHYSNYAIFCEEILHNYDKAKLNYKKAISCDPKYCNAKNRLGILEVKEFDNYERAIELFEDVLSMESDNADALLNLAIATILNGGNIESAGNYYKRAKAIDNSIYNEFLDNVFKV